MTYWHKQDCKVELFFLLNGRISILIIEVLNFKFFRITQQLKVWATFFVSNYEEGEESKKGRMADALAHGGEEGRDKLR